MTKENIQVTADSYTREKLGGMSEEISSEEKSSLVKKISEDGTLTLEEKDGNINIRRLLID